MVVSSTQIKKLTVKGVADQVYGDLAAQAQIHRVNVDRRVRGHILQCEIQTDRVEDQ